MNSGFLMCRLRVLPVLLVINLLSSGDHCLLSEAILISPIGPHQSLYLFHISGSHAFCIIGCLLRCSGACDNMDPMKVLVIISCTLL